MNIIVKPYGSDLCYCRPDTTWERENKDFYSPECVNEIYWSPVVFARVSKAGKCVGKKFVERYYDGVGCGMLLYCGTFGLSVSSGDPRNPATAGCALQRSTGPFAESLATPTRGWENAISDHQPIRQLSHIVDKTSILPHPLFQPVVLEDEKEFIVSCQHDAQGDAALSHNIILSGAKDLLEEALCNASQLTSLRIGDFVAVELKELQKLASREEGNIAVKGEFCEKEIFGFNIVF
jgi:hypothetical protein